MSEFLKLHTLPADKKILRAPNAEISFPLSREIKNLIEDMRLTVLKAPGIGLAAPQIGKNLKLAIINFQEFGVKPFAIINPKVVSKSIKKTGMQEGCLSIPGYFTNVRRPARVEVEFWREDGKRAVLKADKLLAKVLQHEIDHLNGILIRDR